jgi:hypothetical protein
MSKVKSQKLVFVISLTLIIAKRSLVVIDLELVSQILLRFATRLPD